MEVEIKKKLGNFKLEVSFQTEQSSLGILGASGCGKSMTLKCIAGIALPDEGRICIDGQVLFDSKAKINIKPQKRKVGYLFQDYALFPNYTTAQNIASGITGSKEEQKEISQELIKRFQLEGLENQYPHQLSGGQQQRTALARIIASEPNVILLDEPFSALDNYLREQMHMETAKILKNYANSVLVTHSEEEVYKLCSDLLVMDRGQVIEMGKTRDLFKNPKKMQVAKLTGCKNISPIEQVGDYEVRALHWGNAVLRTTEPVLPTKRFVGIRAREIVPALGGENMTNVIPVQIISQTETPFAKQVVCRNTVNLPQQTDLWWKYSKDLFAAPPQFLRLPPEKLLLLE
ncbi:MAG: ATP-binding cassette domain-containing protein [Sporomusaceae bacterium]|jgi:molybdate transport system ATP-binding protein|nr:ATP-binding cassette domain-containing protein [Sporomusaceae bacterium]